jgi:hypothetical protein
MGAVMEALHIRGGEPSIAREKIAKPPFCARLDPKLSARKPSSDTSSLYLLNKCHNAERALLPLESNSAGMNLTESSFVLLSQGALASGFTGNPPALGLPVPQWVGKSQFVGSNGTVAAAAVAVVATAAAAVAVAVAVAVGGNTSCPCVQATDVEELGGSNTAAGRHWGPAPPPSSYWPS